MRFGCFLRSRSLFDSKSILARAIEVCRNPEECFWFRLCYQITVRWTAAPGRMLLSCLNCGSQVNPGVSYVYLLLSPLSLSLSLSLSSLSLSLSLALSLALSPPPPPPLSLCSWIILSITVTPEYVVFISFLLISYAAASVRKLNAY